MALPSGLPPLLSTAKTTGWVLGTTGVVLTCFRLWDRRRSGRLWWDDCWAFISMLLIIVFMTAFGIYFESDPTKFSQSVKVAGYYLCCSLFYCVTWSAKVSVLFTIIRLQYGRARLILAFVAILFGVMWVILIAQLLWTCERNTHWKLGEVPQCTLGFDVAVAQFVTAILADVILIGAPLCMVYKSSGFNRAQKIRLSALFSTSFITTVVSMVHAGLILKVGGVPEGLGAILEASVSLIVANLSVIIAFFFRITTEDVPMPRERESPCIEVNIIGNRGTGPIFTKVNLSSLLRGGNFPENGISSTFISEDGKVRVRKDADEEDDHANPGGPSESKHRPLQGEQQGTSTRRFEETHAISLGSIGYASTEYATASAYHQPAASVA
ncbi:hypothetical protein DFP72DRAFT_179919 [Ephemerocybe angulata]|uniref:Rhodopsin domain-containing protein n=1 Tax=Ephemerocybe angulata TaxID=980116 RepID=A0A8H6MAC5_9AGAR|nr:hypothetical protein DFP72DRAFT_179919 [Tulosesus angulatus]